jgi:SpoVK/Ycf46/Vps4 family AAA+-type ATPase
MFLREGNKYKLIDGTPDGISPNLKPGLYSIEMVKSMYTVSLFFNEIDKYKDSSILDAGIFKRIERYVEDFITPEMEQARKELKGLNKLGLMFLGDPGTGKTYLAGQLAEKMVKEKNAVALIVNEFWKFNLSKLVQQIRETDPNRFIVLIMDEFEKCQPYQLQDPELLSFLDGAMSQDNMLILSLANSTSGMKDFLTDRPGRFEQVYNFDEKDDTVILAMVTSMTPKSYRDRLDLDDITKQLLIAKKRSVDHIKIAIRDAIAEVVYFDNHGSFKSFNSFTANVKTNFGKTVGFSPTVEEKLGDKEDAKAKIVKFDDMKAQQENLREIMDDFEKQMLEELSEIDD